MRVVAQSMSATADRARPSRPVLVAIGEGHGAASLQMAHRLALRDGSPLVVVSVVTPPPLFALEARRALLVPWTIDQQLADRRGTVRERVHRAGWGDWPEAGPHIDIAFGDPAREIARLAQEHDARLIVVGLGPHAPARRLLADGVAWTTARFARCPVLAVSERAGGLPRTAVVGLDFEATSLNAAREAMDLLADHGTMHLVHAWKRIETVVHLDELDAVNEAYVSSLPEQFNRVCGELGRGRRLVTSRVVREGNPTETVLEVAREQGADLIVAGSRGAGRLERWLLGSTATALMRAAETSVLLVPEPPTLEQTRLTRHMTGTSTIRDSTEWNDELDAFVARNRTRRTLLEIDSPSTGTQVQESGYTLVGATYDRHDDHLALMFAAQEQTPDAHLTRSMAGVTSVSVANGPRDANRALCIEYDGGSAVLTFLDPPSGVSLPDSRAAPLARRSGHTRSGG
jgi:nucleotide-binding universal stress UspA family protein